MRWSKRFAHRVVNSIKRKPRRTILRIETLEGRAVPAVSGIIFSDENSNDIRDTGDTGIVNVTVQLFAGETLVDTATTDGAGAYQFSTVDPDTGYQIRIDTTQAVLDNLILVSPNQGSDDTIDSDATLSGTNAIVDFTTDATASDVAFDAGFEAAPAGATLSGQVFRDFNNSGTLNGPDSGIAGVTLTLTGGSLTSPLTIQTDASGNFSFTDLDPGTYTLTETQPTTPETQSGTNTAGTAGGTVQSGDVIADITLTAGQTATGYTFAEIPIVSTGGFVYQDTNSNGVRDTGEAGIASVTITLSGTNVVNGTITPLTATTDSTGAYTFDDLLPGTYTITETQPAGFTDGQEQNGTPPASTVGNDTFSGIDLTSTADQSGGFNFGEIATTATASIAGVVYLDADGDGARDTGERGIAGVQLTLTGTNDLNESVNLTATTTATGAYTFSNLRAGTYTITETQPTGFTDGAETTGTAGGSATAVNDQISGITITSTQNATGYLFAERSNVDLTLTQVLGATRVRPGGTLEISYLIRNRGAVNAEDVTVQINLSNLQFLSASSDDYDHAFQEWAVGDVLAGETKTLNITVRVPFFATFTPSSSVTEVTNAVLTNNVTIGTVSGATPRFWYLSSGWNPLYASFNGIVASAISTSTVNATAPADPNPNEDTLTLGNRIFNDANNNGTLDTGETGVAGVQLQLLDESGNPISGRTATTDANGLYTFAGLAAGSYQVRIEASNFNAGGALANFTSSTASSADPNDNIDNDDNGIVSGSLGNGGVIRSGTITLAVGAEPTNDGDTDTNTNLTLDFGVVAIGANTLTLGDLVFSDPNDNGLFDSGETGIANVTVELRDGQGAVLQTAQTDASGRYAFNNLAAGDYRVRLAATNFDTGGALAGFTPSTTSVADPNNDVDNDSNGVLSGTLGSGGFVESGLITLAAGAEPTTDGDTDANTNLTLDFGLVASLPATPTLELDPQSDTGTAGDDTTDLATVTLIGTTSPNTAVELVPTGATTTSNASGEFSFANVALAVGPNEFTVNATNSSGTSPFTKTITRNSAPTVVDPLDPVSMTAGTSQTIDVAGTFDDNDITNTVVAFDTSSGTFNVELFDRQAPKTVANFLNYVNDGDYTDSIFHRSVQSFVIQGGGFTFEPTTPPSLAAVPTDPAVQNEPDPVNRSNIRGTIAMAKLGGDPNSATSQFFFNLGDNSANLDTQNGGFTVFGELVGASDQAVVDTLAAIPTQDQSTAADLPPSQQGVFGEIPLVDYTGTDFPSDTVRENYAIIDGISIVSQTESLTYSIQNNSDPTVATATIENNRVTIQGLTAGQTTLTIRATDESGSTVDTTVTVTVT